jgi:hypothetical protein
MVQQTDKNFSGAAMQQAFEQMYKPAKGTGRIIAITCQKEAGANSIPSA